MAVAVNACFYGWHIVRCIGWLHVTMNGSIHLPGYLAFENETGSQVCNELLYLVHLGVFYCVLKVGDVPFLTITILDEIACSGLSNKEGFCNPVRGNNCWHLNRRCLGYKHGHGLFLATKSFFVLSFSVCILLQWGLQDFEFVCYLLFR